MQNNTKLPYLLFFQLCVKINGNEGYANRMMVLPLLLNSNTSTNCTVVPAAVIMMDMTEIHFFLCSGRMTMIKEWISMMALMTTPAFKRG